MAMKPKPPMGKTRGQKAESKRMTAQGVSEAKARLAFIDELKKANPGIGFKIPKKQEKELKAFVQKYGNQMTAKKAAKPKAQAPAAKPKSMRPGPTPKPQPKKNGITPLKPLFAPKAISSEMLKAGKTALGAGKRAGKAISKKIGK